MLTVDIGNSRIKWAQWQAGVIIARGVTGYEVEKIADVFTTLFSSLQKPSDIFAVCVAGDEVCQALSEWVRRHWSLEVDYFRTQKRFKEIINAYTEPENHGADRWAAVIACRRHFPDTAACVISAGTAITFDFINKSGQHLGGYILPSLLTMYKALMADTANVKSELNTQYKNKKTIPDNTNDAVNEGLHKLLQAGIREIYQFAQQSVDEPMQIIITGGFAKNILSYPDMPDMHHMPDLVMQGVYSAMCYKKYGPGK